MANIKQQLEGLRKKDTKALMAELATVQAELQKARVNIAFGRLTKPSVITELRKQAARIQTVLKQQEAQNV